MRPTPAVLRIFDRYIFRSFLGPLILTFLIVVFVLMMQFLWLYIDDLVGKGLGMRVILEFLMWGSATLFPLALPLATLLASIMTLGGLGENNELLAMKAAGISLQRILAPLIIVSLGICTAAFFASNNLIPLAYKNIYALRDDITRTKEEIRIPAGMFYDGIDNYMLRIDSLAPKGSQMYGIMVYDHSKHNGNSSVTLADSGSIQLTEDKQNLIFVMHSGYSYDESERTQARDTTYPLQRIRFDRQELVIPLNNHAFSRGDDERFGNEIMAQNLRNLGHRRDSLDSLYVIAKDVYKARLRDFNYFTYYHQIDTGFLATDRPLFPLDSLEAVLNDPTEEVDILYRTSERVDRLLTHVDGFVIEDLRYQAPLNKTRVEWFRKFSLSFACLIFFFIGAPLGAIIRKGGLGTPTVVSMLFFVLYWVIDISGKKLAVDGSASPWLGAWISSLVLLPIGILLFWKATTESALFNPEQYKKILKRIMAFITRTPVDGPKIVFMGTPDFAAGVLDHLIQQHYQVVGVVTMPDKASGRGLKVQSSAVARYALEHNLRLLQPVSLKDPLFLDDLSALEADIFVVVAFRMLPAVVWKMPPRGCFNLHASLLPRYRGAAPIQHALLNGDSQTGLTTFLLDEAIDTGAILYQETVDIAPTDDFGKLHDKLMAAGGPLCAKTIDTLARGRYKAQAQDPSLATPAPKISRSDCVLHCTSEDGCTLWNKVRAFSPAPGAVLRWQQGDKTLEVKVYQASLETAAHDLPCGTLLSDGKTWLKAACRDGYVHFLELQMPGKKRLAVKDFLTGWRYTEGCAVVE